MYGEALSKEQSTQEKSKTYLSKALKSDPDNYETVICLVKVCMALQQYNEALEVYVSAVVVVLIFENSRK